MNRSEMETLQRLLDDAVHGWPQLDSDEYISGADMLEWFAAWRANAKRSLEVVNRELSK